jgi:superfamily II DNA or RNA helicase
LVSVAMASEGLDVPSISHIICLTNVRTPEWITQMCGRAVRIDPQAGPYETQKGYIFAPADKMFVELARKIESDQTEAIAKAKAEKEKKEEFTLDGGSVRPGITPLSSKMLGHRPTQQVYGFYDSGDPVKTQREIERELRESIESHVREFCYIYRVSPKRMNNELFQYFQKARSVMTVPELEAVLRYVEQNYKILRPATRREDVVATGWR